MIAFTRAERTARRATRAGMRRSYYVVVFSETGNRPTGKFIVPAS